jgi:hypothetical protein
VVKLVRGRRIDILVKRINKSRFTRSYGDAWTSILKVHETIGDQHVKFSTEITEVADDLQLLFKDTEKSRKQAKEQGLRQERLVSDADMALEKVSIILKELTVDNITDLIWIFRPNKSMNCTVSNGNSLFC